MMDRLELWLSKVSRWAKLRWYKLRLEGLIPFYETLDQYPACPHEVRVPMERVAALSPHKTRMLQSAMIDYMRPSGCTIHVCHRCYCLIASRVTKNQLGYE